MRLIDSDKLYCETKDIIGNKAGAKAWAIANAIRTAHTVEAEPVRHSKWISLNNSSHKYCESCSVEFNIRAYERNDYRFCPHCGAKMDGGVSDETIHDKKQILGCSPERQ